MDGTPTTSTLWGLIGLQIEHVRGGTGRLDYAHSRVWEFGVSWAEGIESYPSIVPAEDLLLAGMPMLDFLCEKAPGAFHAVTSWSTFSFVSKTSNPKQFMDNDQFDMNVCIRCGNYDRAAALYETVCSYFLAPAEFQAVLDMAKQQIARRNHREFVSARLIAHDLRGAKDYYDLNCREWWDIDEFQGLVDKAHEAHRKIVRKNWDERRIARRSGLQLRVVALLQGLDVDAADKVYDQCKDWWPKSQYEVLRAYALGIDGVVQEYAGTSMSRLDELFNTSLSEKISGSDFALLKLPKFRVRLARLGMPLNNEQLLACARPERHRLIRARAGSGKTRTLAAHAALTIHDEGLEPDQVLILAFNKKAANEIRDRVRGSAGVVEFRTAKTFHSLAWHLADHSGRQLIFDDGNLAPSRRKQMGFVERLVGSIMNPAFREKLYEFFRNELEQLDRLGSNLSKEEYVAFRRSLTDYTLGGETVKSNGEKFIADYLFEHGVEYKYERVWSWDKQDRLYGGAYRPDFSIIHGGRDFILEHWAIDPDNFSSRVPDWWETSTQDYLDQIKAKREYCTKRGILLLETHTGMQARGRRVFESSLQKLLERAGIVCRKLEHDELVRRVAEAPRTVSRMAELFLQFISRAKKRGWAVETMTQIVRDSPDIEPRNRAFHALAVHAYAAYERRLTEHSFMDFDDLLISATECIKKHGGSARLQLDKLDSIAICDLRWILIDEFQDFSELYYRLIGAILAANPLIRVVAVGDDWQAINGFAGAQLTFFNSFAEFFPGAGTAVISTNRRSGKAIVGAGNELMEGRGMPALAHHDFFGDISSVMIDKVWPEDGSIYLKVATSIRDDGRRSVNWELARALKACTEFIVKSVYLDDSGTSRWMPSVLILARTDRAYGTTIAELGSRLEQVLLEHPDLKDLANDFAVGKHAADLEAGTALIEVMTAHKAKGTEADTVIVLEAVSRQFPKLHADNQLFGPFGVTVEDVLAEERRLFYVATTRAQHRLMLLSETGRESPYLNAMQAKRLPGTQSGRIVQQLGADTGALKAYLDRIDPESLIRQNVSRQAGLAWERLAGQLPGLPKVGFSLTNELHAELAWPALNPPVVILTGRYRERSSAWSNKGWKVY